MQYLNLFKLVNDALKQSNALPVALPVTLPVVDSEVGQPNLPEEDSPPIGTPETGKFFSEEESREGLLHDNVLVSSCLTVEFYKRICRLLPCLPKPKLRQPIQIHMIESQ